MRRAGIAIFTITMSCWARCRRRVVASLTSAAAMGLLASELAERCQGGRRDRRRCADAGSRPDGLTGSPICCSSKPT